MRSAFALPSLFKASLLLVACGARPTATVETAAREAGVYDAASRDGAPPVDGGGDAGTLGTVAKPDGITPSNFACNHHFVDPPVEGSAAHAFQVTVISNVAAPSPARGGSLTLVDPGTASTLGMPTASIDATGLASLSVPGYSRAAWKVSASGAHCDPCVDTYEFNRLVGPDATGTSTPLVTTAFEIDHAGGWSEDGLGGPYLVGTILDCDGDPVMNATVALTGATRCGSSNRATASACFVFPDELIAIPELATESTTALGQFVVYMRTPGPVSVQAVGLLPGDKSASILGTLDAVTVAGAVSFGTTSPLGK